MLSINNNMMALTASNNLMRSYGSLGKSIDALSSGLRVKGAADDAAGLAVRELFRADIAAINQGIRNANDAHSMLQIMDGAAAVINEKLIRLKELAEQAATGTYSDAQRDIMQQEFDQMRAEIDRIANSTSFNGIKLLNVETLPYEVVNAERTIDMEGTIAAAGAIYRVTIDGTDFTYTAAAGDTLENIVAGLAGAIDGNAAYSASPSGNVITITAGAGDKVITTSVDSGPMERTIQITGGVPTEDTRYTVTIDGTDHHYDATANESLNDIAAGLAAVITTDSPYTATSDGTTITIATGAGTAAITSPTDIARTIAMVGPDPSGGGISYSIDIDGDTFTYTSVFGDNLAAVAAGLAAEINANSSYSASADGVDITIASGAGTATITPDADRTIRVTGPDPAGGPYDYTINIGSDTFTYNAPIADSLDDVAAELADLINADPNYTATVSGDTITITSGAGTAIITQDDDAALDINTQFTGAINDPISSNINISPPAEVTITSEINNAEIEGLPSGRYIISAGAVKIHFGTANNVGEDYYGVESRDMTSRGLGLDEIIITNQESAQVALEQINDAIAKKDAGRAHFGAMMNRLENTVTVLTLQAENMQAAESRISDVDVAREMTKFMSLQIKSQAAIAMLSQANVMPQMAMQLLGG